MVDNGIQKRIQRRVLEKVKETGAWNPEKHFTDAVENLALFCIENKLKLEKWLKKNKKK